MDTILVNILGWTVLLAFLGLTIFDIVKGVPTRLYSVKKGLNSIVRVVLAFGSMLSAVILISITSAVLEFFKDNLIFELPYGSGPISNFAGFYWAILIGFLPWYLVYNSMKVNLFKLTDKEYEWERGRKEEERRKILEGKSKIKILLLSLFRKGV